MIAFKIDGKTVHGERGESLLKVALANGIRIPHLCYHEAVKPYGACRLCLVEVTKESHGRKRTQLTTSCNYPVLEGIDVVTSSEKILKNRRMVLELLMARVPGSPQLEALGREYGAKTGRFKASDKDCILCGLCVSVCRDVVGVDALGFMGRGAFKDVRPPFGEASKECIGCAACVMACPVDCIKMEESPTRRRIVRWGRDLPMKVCEACGYPFAPTFQLLHFAKLIGTKVEDYKLCSDCRK
jgi:NADH dehydrogenase/NADH:ubiquinone oxidoreductase subunit G